MASSNAGATSWKPTGIPLLPAPIGNAAIGTPVRLPIPPTGSEPEKYVSMSSVTPGAILRNPGATIRSYCSKNEFIARCATVLRRRACT
jgi:hypothetical protein